MTWFRQRRYLDPQAERTAEWVCDMMNASQATAAMLNQPAQVIVAQAALESGWGRYAIGNNIFGIKATKSWGGPVQIRRTAEQNPDGSIYYVDAAFRDYPTMAACIADHFAFLRDNKRYAAAGVFSAKTPEEYFTALKRAGYATDVDYVSKLMAMMRSVGIWLDGMVQADTPAPPKSEARMLMVGMKGDDVKRLQDALLGLQLYIGKVDGDFGPRTEQAVREYQRERGLTVDGIAGAQTLRSLNLA